jgi:hypothetical protein
MPSTSASRVLDIPSRLGLLRAECVHGALHGAKDLCRQRVLGEGLVVDPGLQGAVGADQRSQRVAQVVVHHAGRLECRGHQRAAQELQQRVVAFEQLLGNPDVAIGQLFGIEKRSLLVHPRILQMLTLERAEDRHLPAGAAADGANVATNTGAVAPGPTRLADCTSHW